MLARRARDLFRWQVWPFPRLRFALCVVSHDLTGSRKRCCEGPPAIVIVTQFNNRANRGKGLS